MPNGFRLAHSDGCQSFVIPSRDLFGEELLRRKALVRTARPPSNRDPPQVRIVRVLQLVLRDDPAQLLRRVTALFVAVGRVTSCAQYRVPRPQARACPRTRGLPRRAGVVRPSAVSRKASRRQGSAEAARGK